MTVPGTFEALLNAKTIGLENLAGWSNGFDPKQYLNVLPHPYQSVPLVNGWTQWQQDNQRYGAGQYSSMGADGTYYSSWGPSRELTLTLRMSTLSQLNVPGLGEIRANPGETAFDSVYDNSFWSYNGQIPGPLLVANPGDTINIKLINDLEVDAAIEESNPYAFYTNLHKHGSHVSPIGNSDNVMLTLAPGEEWDVSWELPDNQLVGLDWGHPHYHGGTSISIAKGLSFPLLVLPDPEKNNNVSSYDPTKEYMFLLPLQTLALAQEERPSSPTDPLNQDPNGEAWPIGTPPKLFSDETGDYYQYSPARFNGNNYYPIDKYDPTNPRPYGDAVGLMPNENVIHTVGGYYNPTLDVTTGKWATFMFENFSLNSTHVIQLIRKDENGNLSLEATTVIGTDGDLAQWASPYKSGSEQLPILMPGGRLAVQHAFSKPGEYYFISNASKEVLGDDAPVIANIPVGNGDTYLGYHDGFQITPSQVLATVRVEGDEVAKLPAQPAAWKDLTGQYAKSAELRDFVGAEGVDKERTFQWATNAPVGKEYNDPATWEGTWVINGQYWTHSPLEQPTLTTVMLDTVERWKLQNLSGGRKTTNLDGTETYNVVGQSHPFHLHTNEFLVESINGLAVSADPSINEVGGSFYSTFMDNLLLTPRYTPGTATPENPYGIPGSIASTATVPTTDLPFEADILIEFADYPGLFVDHCHLLFHEDGGMMAPVQTILNTNSSWLASASATNTQNVKFSLASDISTCLEFQPYIGGRQSESGIVVASGDVNADREVFESGVNGATVNVTDNIADIVTIQKTQSLDGRFIVKVFDGQKLQSEWPQSGADIDPSKKTLLYRITPFSGLQIDRKAQADLAIGDIDGDGYGDVVVTVGGGSTRATAQVYSGKDGSLFAEFNPFASGELNTAINVAVGDIDADNFADILIGEGEGGSGGVLAFSGIELYKNNLLERKDRLTGEDLAASSSMIDGGFHPYGCEYTGAVDVAATYVLPRGFGVDQLTQSVYANITTLAVNKMDADDDPVLRNFLFLGHGGAHGSEMAATESADHCCAEGNASHEMHGTDEQCCSEDDASHEMHGADEQCCAEDDASHGMLATDDHCCAEGSVSHEMHCMHEMATQSATAPHMPASVAYTSSIKIGAAAQSIQTQYLDLSADQRGEATLLLSLADGGQSIYHIGPDSLTSGDWNMLSPDVYAWISNSLI